MASGQQAALKVEPDVVTVTQYIFQNRVSGWMFTFSQASRFFSPLFSAETVLFYEIRERDSQVIRTLGDEVQFDLLEAGIRVRTLRDKTWYLLVIRTLGVAGYVEFYPEGLATSRQLTLTTFRVPSFQLQARMHSGVAGSFMIYCCGSSRTVAHVVPQKMHLFLPNPSQRWTLSHQKVADFSTFYGAFAESVRFNDIQKALNEHFVRDVRVLLYANFQGVHVYIPYTVKPFSVSEALTRLDLNLLKDITGVCGDDRSIDRAVTTLMQGERAKNIFDINIVRHIGKSLEMTDEEVAHHISTVNPLGSVLNRVSSDYVRVRRSLDRGVTAMRQDKFDEDDGKGDKAVQLLFAELLGLKRKVTVLEQKCRQYDEMKSEHYQHLMNHKARLDELDGSSAACAGDLKEIKEWKADYVRRVDASLTESKNLVGRVTADLLNLSTKLSDKIDRRVNNFEEGQKATQLEVRRVATDLEGLKSKYDVFSGQLIKTDEDLWKAIRGVDRVCNTIVSSRIDAFSYGGSVGCGQLDLGPYASIVYFGRVKESLKHDSRFVDYNQRVVHIRDRSYHCATFQIRDFHLDAGTIVSCLSLLPIDGYDINIPWFNALPEFALLYEYLLSPGIKVSQYKLVVSGTYTCYFPNVVGMFYPIHAVAAV
ncbi:VP7 [Tarumizu tick virus]|uniref:VP7 n=1 Tax=Tarumizu tick virus TaxID=2014339 RepID=A0A292FZ59_9REOV|nr:VP7 [Tarumizu tick virus]BBA54741.1 VP7 [Tarumizu tick virus]